LLPVRGQFNGSSNSVSGDLWKQEKPRTTVSLYWILGALDISVLFAAGVAAVLCHGDWSCWLFATACGWCVRDGVWFGLCSLINAPSRRLFFAVWFFTALCSVGGAVWCAEMTARIVPLLYKHFPALLLLVHVWTIIVTLFAVAGRFLSYGIGSRTVVRLIRRRLL